jgi:hypothetical protein
MVDSLGLIIFSLSIDLSSTLSRGTVLGCCLALYTNFNREEKSIRAGWNI